MSTHEAARRSAGERVVEVQDDRLADALDMTTHLAWAPALTPEQYREREARLKATPWARAGMRTWVLVPETSKCWGSQVPEGSLLSLEELQPLASLETFRQDALGPDGQPGVVYGVASVFTQPKVRGRGFATRLCCEVQQRLKALDPSALAAVLYSDVGDTLYQRAGFSPAPFVPTFSRFYALHSNSTFADKHLEDVASADMAAEVDADVRLTLQNAAWRTVPIVREDMERMVAPLVQELRQGQKRGTLVVLPCAKQILWLVEREVCCCSQLGIPSLPQSGARMGDSFMLWTLDVSKQQRFLKILIIHHPQGSPDECLASLAAAAVLVAVNSGAYVGGVLSWGPQGLSGRDMGYLEQPTKTLETALAAAGVCCRNYERTVSLPMLAPLAQHVDESMWQYVPQALWL